MYDWKEKLLDAIRKDNLQVRGNALKVMVEQSPQRKVEYSQYAKAVEMLREERDLAEQSWEPCGRTLRIYAAPGWQELGKPGVRGWEWNREAFVQAQMVLPAFLSQPLVEAKAALAAE